MKKIILSAVVAAAAIFGGFTANQTSSEVAMSDLQLENVQILAEAENYHLHCKYKKDSVCEWLHPTNPKLDERQDDAEWR